MPTDPRGRGGSRSPAPSGARGVARTPATRTRRRRLLSSRRALRRPPAQGSGLARGGVERMSAAAAAMSLGRQPCPPPSARARTMGLAASCDAKRAGEFPVPARVCELMSTCGGDAVPGRTSPSHAGRGAPEDDLAVATPARGSGDEGAPEAVAPTSASVAALSRGSNDAPAGPQAAATRTWRRARGWWWRAPEIVEAGCPPRGVRRVEHAHSSGSQAAKIRRAARPAQLRSAVDRDRRARRATSTESGARASKTTTPSAAAGAKMTFRRRPPRRRRRICRREIVMMMMMRDEPLSLGSNTPTPCCMPYDRREETCR